MCVCVDAHMLVRSGFWFILDDGEGLLHKDKTNEKQTLYHLGKRQQVLGQPEDEFAVFLTWFPSLAWGRDPTVLGTFTAPTSAENRILPTAEYVAFIFLILKNHFG